MAVSADLSGLVEESPGEQANVMNSAEYCGLSGWYWYCDEHDAHGIADSEDEAVFVLDAHVEYHELHRARGCDEDGLQVVFHQPEGSP